MNILLQHWSGELNELCLLSSANMSDYAQRMGAEYRLIRGDVFRDGLASPCQKLFMLDESFDAYDTVVMVDADMFAVRALADNVFEQEGTGLFSQYTEGVFEKCRQKHPDLTDARFAFWGGAIYRMPRELRKRLRRHIRDQEMARFSGNFNDEGIVHRLACLERITQDRLPGRWCQCSYLPNPQDAAFIHVRFKVTPSGPRRTKMENYRSLEHLL